MGLQPNIVKPHSPGNRQSPFSSGGLRVYSFWLPIICEWGENPDENHAGGLREHERLPVDLGAWPSPN